MVDLRVLNVFLFDLRLYNEIWTVKVDTRHVKVDKGQFALLKVYKI